MSATTREGESLGEPGVDSRMGGWTGITFADVEVGKVFPVRRLKRSVEDIQRFASVAGWPDTPRVVPAFLLNELRSLKHHVRLPPGVLHAREELELLSAAFPDEELKVEVRFSDKFIKNDKRFVVVGQRVYSAVDGRDVLNIKRTFYWPC